MAGMADVISRLSVWLGIDTAAFEKGADIAEKRLNKMTREFEKAGKKIEEIGQKFSVALSVPIAAAGAAIVKSAADFEQSMIKLGISSQATAGEMKEMSDLALKLGKDTIFGASDAANAMDELAKSGLSARDILDGAATAAVNLASATGSELSPAANAITDVMAQFGIAASQLPSAVDQIAGAVNESKLGFEDYSLAIAQAGGVAGSVGVSFTDFNTTLAATSSLFSSGSDAGTSFRTFLSSLVGKSKEAKAEIDRYGLSFYDANLNLRSMAEIAEELRTKLGGLNDQAKQEVLTKIFGSDATRTALALMNQGADGLNRVAAAIAKTDAAAQSAQRLQGFYGQLENLKGAIETLAIRIGQSGVLEAFTAIITKVGDFVDWLSEASPGVLSFAVTIGTLAAAIGPALMAIGRLTSFFAPLLTTITTVVLPAFARFRLEMVAITALAGPAQAAMAGMAMTARAAGTALLAAFGGPVGAIIVGVSAALIGLGLAARDTAASMEELQVTADKAQARLDDAREQARLAGIQVSNLDKTTSSAAGSVSTLTGALWKSVDAMVAVSKNAKIAALATIALENAQARQVINQIEPKVRGMDAAASRNRRGNAFFGQTVSGYEGLTQAQRDQLQVDRARIALSNSIIERNRETERLIKQMPEGSYKGRGSAESPKDSSQSSSPPAASGDGGSKKKGRTGSQGRDPAEISYREEQDMRSLRIEELRAREQLAATAEERANFQSEILALDRQSREAEIAEAVRKNELTREEADARLAIIKTLYGQSVTEDGSGDLIVEKQKSLYGEMEAREALLDAERDRATIARAEYEIDRTALQHAYDMAETQAERRTLALRMLDLDERQERAILDGILATEAVGSARWEEARRQRDALAGQFADRRNAAMRDTESPLERWRREASLTAAQMSEAFENIQVRGLQSLNDGIVDAIVNFKSLGSVFSQVAKQIIADLLRIQIQKALVEPLSKLFNLSGLFGGSSSLPGTAGGMDLRGFSNFKIPGNANGTSFWRGGPSLVGERGPELVDLPRGARVTPNRDLAGMGGGIATIVPSPYFDVIVNGHVMRAGPGIAEAGAARAHEQSAFASNWKLA